MSRPISAKSPLSLIDGFDQLTADLNRPLNNDNLSVEISISSRKTYRVTENLPKTVRNGKTNCDNSGKAAQKNLLFIMQDFDTFQQLHCNP